MKWFFACVVLSVLALSSVTATRYYGRPSWEANQEEALVTALESARLENAASPDSQVDIEQADIVAPILKLVNSGVDIVGPLITQLGKIGINVGQKLLTNILDCIICGRKCLVPSEAQDVGGDESGRVAKLMAIVDALENVNALEKKLSDLKNSMMMDDKDMAEVQVMNVIQKVIEKVREIAKSIKSASKKVLCRNNFG